VDAAGSAGLGCCFCCFCCFCLCINKIEGCKVWHDLHSSTDISSVPAGHQLVGELVFCLFGLTDAAQHTRLALQLPVWLLTASDSCVLMLVRRSCITAILIGQLLMCECNRKIECSGSSLCQKMSNFGGSSVDQHPNLSSNNRPRIIPVISGVRSTAWTPGIEQYRAPASTIRPTQYRAPASTIRPL
jgi:hypothetical protein